MFRMKAPLLSETMAVVSLIVARATMLPRLQKLDSLSSGDLPKNQRTQHRDGIRRGAVKMPGSFSGCIKTVHRAVVGQHLSLFVSGQTAECIGDRADQRIGPKRRLGERPRPVRFRRGEGGGGPAPAPG